MIGILGVDPGVNGGFAVLRSDGTIVHLAALRPSMAHRELIEALRLALDLLRGVGPHSVFMEKVGYMPRDGGLGANTFGRIDGLLRGGLLMADHKINDVFPQQWQAALDCLTGGNKNVSKRKAQELWPGEKWTHAIADAALIAEFGRRRLAA